MRGLQALPCLSTMDLVYLGAHLLWSISQCIIDLGLVLVYNGLYWCPSTMVYFAMHLRCCSTHHRWLTLPLLVHTMTLLAKAAHFPHNFDKDKLSDGLLSGLLCLYCLITKQHCERINFLPDYSLRNYTPGAGGWKLKPGRCRKSCQAQPPSSLLRAAGI